MDIVIVGDEDFMIGFKLAGIKRGIPALSPDEYEEAVSGLLEDASAGLVIISQEGYEALSRPLRRKLEQITHPVVFPIGGETNVNLREHIIKVVGVDLWK